ncbi:heterokaryon incompatibility protein-domain-containing protein [Xylariaceae sp. FL1272]|nr:heterokaryon incompatibility protein-domain-containing protein [Xylariaceae sp. FL1272]
MSEARPSHLYQYRPLESEDTVRVLRLDQAGDKFHPLRGTIVHWERHDEETFTSLKEYSALSYTWGDPDLSGRLFLHEDENAESNSYLRISQNLETILQHLRRSHKSCCLCFDAICLNQDDQVERGRQIPLMGDIFSHARKVYMWLGSSEGESGEDAAVGFAFFRKRSVISGNASQSLVIAQSLDGKLQTHLRNFFARP